MAAVGWRGIVDAYRAFLPALGRVVTLGEGATPLIRSPWLTALAGRPVWLKLEGANPTGSFKDRGMTVAVSAALDRGARAVVCASTGNTAAAAAAYAARAGLPCWIVVPAGGVARGKLVQAAAHGARVAAVEGGFERALDLVREVAGDDVVLVNSVNPMRLEGQATVAYEVCDALGDAPASLVLPVGNGGNITACWLGFRRYHEAGRIRRLPALVGVQAEGASPLVQGAPVAAPRTVASAIRIGRPATWAPAVEAARASGGRFLAVTDDEILGAQAALGREGVFVEPASAAAAAGVARAAADLPAGDVVCVLTGHGLKDPDAVAGPEPVRVPATAAALRALIAGTQG